MKLKNGIVYLESLEPWYSKEKTGVKNNTVRVLSGNECNLLKWCMVIGIEIYNPDTKTCFSRELSDVSRIGGMCGHHIVVFTWIQEEKKRMKKQTNYEKGRALEYKVQTMFRRKGFYVTRSAGSHGPADLVAIKKNQRPIFIQCKTGTAKVDMEEHNKLFRAALEAGARPLIVTKDDRKPIVFKAVTGIALKRGDEERVINGF